MLSFIEWVYSQWRKFGENLDRESRAVIEACSQAPVRLVYKAFRALYNETSRIWLGIGLCLIDSVDLGMAILARVPVDIIRMVVQFLPISPHIQLIRDDTTFLLPRKRYSTIIEPESIKKIHESRIYWLRSTTELAAIIWPFRASSLDKTRGLAIYDRP